MAEVLIYLLGQDKKPLGKVKLKLAKPTTAKELVKRLVPEFP